MNPNVILDEGIQYRVDFPIKASTTLEANGAVAIKNGELQPATSALFASGGAITFLGVTFDTTKNEYATAQSSEPPVNVRRGFTWAVGLDAADPPTVSELWGNVALSGATTVKKTVLGTDPTFKLLSFLSPTRALVFVPFP